MAPRLHPFGTHTVEGRSEFVDGGLMANHVLSLRPGDLLQLVFQHESRSRQLEVANSEAGEREFENRPHEIGPYPNAAVAAEDS